MPDMQTSATVAPSPIKGGFDEDRSARFSERVVDLFNGAAVTLMIAIGHRTGLFDAMARLNAPATSLGVAEVAGLDERYVREWLATMVTGRIVDYDPATARYRLPPEHAAWLTRGNPVNMAVTAQLIPTVSMAQDAIVERFRTGGGTRYSEYPCFHAYMAEDSGQTIVAALFDHILPLVPGLTERLERGITVLDAGCGVGRALIRMAGRFPDSRFVGHDLCEDALEMGRGEALAQGLTNVRLEARDLTGFAEPEIYDFITTFDAVHDQKDPASLLRGIHASLKPGGYYLMQDIGGSSVLERNLQNPFAPLLYTASCMHCMAASLGQGGAGLGTMWGVELAESMLREAGFDDIVMHRLEHDPLNAYFVCRKG